MFSKKQLLTRGMLDVAPHMLSVIPFGIICGAIGVDLGFNPYLVYGMSIIIFGGASQIVFLQLLSGGASSFIAVASVGIINTRHLLYGAVLSEYLEKLSLVKKFLISYFIVDQGFAESNKFFKKNRTEQHLHYHLVGTGCTLWICWQISTLAGIVLGSFVPEELGLKFTIPLTFIAIIVQDLKKFDHVIVMLTCGISSLLFFDAPLKSYIIISPVIALCVAAIILRLKK
jgi:predicted branched-subunit amino acid permease|tara:strand:+ start:550 stop:1236 length:687 start_codon:yes stop_codon:yes gene_type:complete